MKLLITTMRQSWCSINYKILFPDFSRVYNMVKLYRNGMKGNQNNLELAGVFLHYSKCEKEIQGKSTFVRVSARFELARVRVIGSQPHLYRNFISILSSFLTYIKLKFHRQRCMNS